MIGGIIVSTVLSLVVVPSFFLIMDDLSRLLAWIFGRLVGKKDEETQPLDNEALTQTANEAARTVEALEDRVARWRKSARPQKAPQRRAPFHARSRIRF